MSISEPLRERVDDVLWVELGRLARTSSSRLTARFDAIEALAQIGLLEPADAETWRARFTAAATPADPIARTPELRTRLNACLAAVIEGGSRDESLALLSDLDGLALLDAEDVDWWYDRLPPLEDRNDRLVTLERTLVGPAERRRGARIVTVDLFDRGVVVRVHWARPGRDQSPLPDEVEPAERPVSTFDRLRLQDDVGTAYRVLGGGGGGGSSQNWDAPTTFERYEVFGPRVPEAARELVIRIGESTFEVAL